MEFSGVEIRCNGRLMECGLDKRIWSKQLHLSRNHFLMVVELTADQPRSLPPTWPTKTGFRDGDPRLEKLFAWLRANVPPIVPQESVKKRLTRALAEQKQAEPNVIRVVLEKSTYCSLDLRVKICLSAGIRRRCMSPRRGPARPRPDSGSSG